MRNSTSAFSAVFISLLAGALAAGCSSSGRMAEGEKAVKGFAEMRSEITQAQAEVDQVLKSLSALSSGSDLPKAHKSFNEEVADLRDEAEDAKKTAAEMRERQAAFVKKWQEEMSKLDDPNLKSTLDQRRSAVQSNFDQVRNSSQAVREAYTPFMNRLTQIQKTLSIDLTPQTVSGIKPTLDAAQKEGQTLKQKLSDFQAQLDRIQAGLSAKGGAKS